MRTTDYLTQATDFLRATGTDFKAEFLKHGKHFDSDKDTRDIYKIRLTRGTRSFSFDFGQSIANSHQFTPLTIYAKNIVNKITEAGKLLRGANIRDALKKHGIYSGVIPKDFRKNENFGAPSEYDVLACLTKYDPESFTAFCHEFGYDTDSKSAEVVYNAVLNEWHNVAMLWNDNELNQLREIQ